MRKWKKLLLPAMCAFMLQIPVIVNAEAVDSSNNVTSAVETPVATPTPALLDGIVKKGSRTYFYKNGVMQKRRHSLQDGTEVYTEAAATTSIIRLRAL